MSTEKEHEAAAHRTSKGIGKGTGSHIVFSGREKKQPPARWRGAREKGKTTTNNALG